MSTNRHDLHAVFREVRRDWDLSTSGLREAWDSGDLLPSTGGTSGLCPSRETSPQSP